MSPKDFMAELQAFFFHGAVSITLLLAATVANYSMISLYDKSVNVSGVYLLTIMIISMLTGSYFWGIFSAACSVVGTNFCFTYPFFAIDFSITGYPLTFLIMTLVASGTCALTVYMRKQRDQANAREQMAVLINVTDRQLLQAETHDEVVAILVEYLHMVLEKPVYYIQAPDGILQCMQHLGGTQGALPERYHPAVWRAMEQKRMISMELYSEKPPVREDWHKEPEEVVLCAPVVWQERVFGVACVLLGAEGISKETWEYIQGAVNHFAIAFDRQELSEKHQTILIEKQKEETRGYLLRAISHDLRTPLTGILGASGAIMENESRMQSDLKQRLMRDIHEEAQWLLRMIENVLSVTKIGNYNPQLKKTVEPVEEVIADSVARCKKYFPDLKIEIRMPDEFIMLPMDAVLIRQVVTNLIDNAYRHGNSKEKIELEVAIKEPYLEISVQDYGDGLSFEDAEKLFTRSSRDLPRSGDIGRGGLGLGTAICRTVVEAHEGKIFAQPVEGKGLKVTFLLPMEEMEHHE